jgi:hypothetical protein
MTRGYIITFIFSFIIEIASTMYISTVADKNVVMIFWATIGPFLSLPFVGYLIEANGWNQRIRLAFCSSMGYSLGATVIYLFFSKLI